MSGVRFTHHYLPGMKNGNWGCISFISSKSALNIHSEIIHYGMIRTAQLAVAREIVETTTRAAATVNLILPGE
jgi:NAD(P)-dependent dehydrogenase (short-subunit alcohol dehydrogenase family)